MSLFLFNKNVGIAVFGLGKMNPLEAAQILPLEIKFENIAAHCIIKKISELKLEIEDFKISINDDIATVSGLTESQAVKEKTILIVGNSIGIKTVIDKIKVGVESKQSIFYTVLEGDSLGKIAKFYYKNLKNYIDLFEANKPMLTNPDKIYPGQVLRIPALD